MTTADAVHWADVSVAEIRGTEDENTGRRKYVMTLGVRTWRICWMVPGPRRPGADTRSDRHELAKSHP